MAGIYIHIPFCEKKCFYCDFYSITDGQTMGTYIQFLLKEIDLYRHYFKAEPIESIYFGGGTPSLLHPSAVTEVLNKIYSYFLIKENAEITLEVNPGTVDAQKLIDYRQVGVNRLSIGVQSFHDEDLIFLTRIHNSLDALRCYDDARKAEFKNVSIDLIFGLPTQTKSSWNDNLNKALELLPEHISAYSLIIEEGTPLFKLVKSKQVTVVSEEIETEMMNLTIERLTSRGYNHYEISNYAKPGFESIHNSNYWNHSNYLGFGPSAHSYWNGKRWWNVRTVFSYYSRIKNGMMPIANGENLSRLQIANEMIMLGLRSQGIDLDRLKSFFNFDGQPNFNKTIGNLINEQLVYISNNVLRLTAKGLLICDEVVNMLTSNLETI
ncbi:MAG: radical SAM family heme chaperone HemW [Bacteroidota bacterium]|nr:radical SAM family heme chaperone HemW [Bacteroidota bacterium]